MSNITELLKANRTAIINKLNAQLGDDTKETLVEITTAFAAYCEVETPINIFEVECCMQDFISENRGSFASIQYVEAGLVKQHRDIRNACMGRI